MKKAQKAQKKKVQPTTKTKTAQKVPLKKAVKNPPRTRKPKANVAGAKIQKQIEKSMATILKMPMAAFTNAIANATAIGFQRGLSVLDQKIELSVEGEETETGPITPDMMTRTQETVSHDDF